MGQQQGKNAQDDHKNTMPSPMIAATEILETPNTNNANKNNMGEADAGGGLSLSSKPSPSPPHQPLRIIGKNSLHGAARASMRALARVSHRSHQEESASPLLPEAVYKIIILGDSGVGKSNLLLRFIKNEFLIDSKPTIGVECFSKMIQIQNNKLLKAQFWDTAGQERYHLIASSYYRNAVGALLVYDVTSRQSFDHVIKWLKEVEEYAEKDCVCILVGNKIDLVSKQAQREVTKRDGREFAEKNDVAFIETSALERFGVNNAFQHLLQEIDAVQEKKRMQEQQHNINGRLGLKEEHSADRKNAAEQFGRRYSNSMPSRRGRGNEPPSLTEPAEVYSDSQLRERWWNERCDNCIIQ